MGKNFKVSTAEEMLGELNAPKAPAKGQKSARTEDLSDQPENYSTGYFREYKTKRLNIVLKPSTLEAVKRYCNSVILPKADGQTKTLPINEYLSSLIESDLRQKGVIK